MKPLAAVVLAASMVLGCRHRHVDVAAYTAPQAGSSSVGYFADLLASPLDPSKQVVFYDALRVALTGRSAVSPCREVDVPRSRLIDRGDLMLGSEPLGTKTPERGDTICDGNLCPDIVVLIGNLAIATTQRRGGGPAGTVTAADGTVIPVFSNSGPSGRTRTIFTVSYVFWDNRSGEVLSFGRVRRPGKLLQAEQILAEMGRRIASRCPAP
jgi:hypothetical protein